MSSASPSPPKGIKIPTPLSDNPHNTSRSKKPNPNIPVTRIKQYIKKLQKKGKKHGPVNYLPYNTVLYVAYLAIMNKYQTKCMVTYNDIDYLRIYIDDEYYPENIKLLSVLDGIAKQIINCIKRGEKIICIPLMITHLRTFSNHINMLIYRPDQNTIERFEPQWTPIDITPIELVEINKRVDRIVKNIFEVHMRLYLDKYTPVYHSPEFICPNRYKGFQTIEESLFTEENKTAGFCAMWSLFVMELMFLNPDMKTTEVMEIAVNFMRQNPQYIKNVIRGYVIEIEKIVDVFMKEIDPQSNRFSFSDMNIVYEISNKEGEIKKHVSKFSKNNFNITKKEKKITKGGREKKPKKDNWEKFVIRYWRNKITDEITYKEPSYEEIPYNRVWKQYYDKSAKSFYWYNKDTGEATWILPQKPHNMEDNWEKHNVTYWKHKNTELVVYNDPCKLQKYYDEDTKSYYWYNPCTEETTWYNIPNEPSYNRKKLSPIVEADEKTPNSYYKNKINSQVMKGPPQEKLSNPKRYSIALKKIQQKIQQKTTKKQYKQYVYDR